MKWTRVALFMDPLAAEVVRERLMKVDIPAALHHEPIVARLWFVTKRESGVRLEVPNLDIERAAALLKVWSAEIGFLQSAVRCPECGSLHVDYPQFTEKSLFTNVVMGLVTELRLIERDFFCEDCHCMWSKPSLKPRRQRAHLAPDYFLKDSPLLRDPVRRSSSSK